MYKWKDTHLVFEKPYRNRQDYRHICLAHPGYAVIVNRIRKQTERTHVLLFEILSIPLDILEPQDFDDLNY